jgi:hypothetical protein
MLDMKGNISSVYQSTLRRGGAISEMTTLRRGESRYPTNLPCMILVVLDE